MLSFLLVLRNLFLFAYRETINKLLDYKTKRLKIMKKAFMSISLLVISLSLLMTLICGSVLAA